jgi:hypothetical protein
MYDDIIVYPMFSASIPWKTTVYFIDSKVQIISSSRYYGSMEKPALKELYTDPRFLEVMRELLGCTSPAQQEEGSEEVDDVTRRIRVKIALRMQKRKAKRQC